MGRLDREVWHALTDRTQTWIPHSSDVIFLLFLKVLKALKKGEITSFFPLKYSPITHVNTSQSLDIGANLRNGTTNELAYALVDREVSYFMIYVRFSFSFMFSCEGCQKCQ